MMHAVPNRTVLSTALVFLLLGLLIGHVRYLRERAVRRLLAERVQLATDDLTLELQLDGLIRELQRPALEFMRGNRDFGRAVLLAHEQGLDIYDELRALVQTLSDQIAQIEEHVT